MKKKIQEALIVLVITALVLEILLQWVSRYGNASNNILIKAVYKSIQPPRTWQQYFLTNYQQGELVYFGLYQPDSLLGWSLKPSVQVTQQGLAFTSNRQGYRSLTDFNDDQKKYQVLIVGDSFTFGDEISDGVTWPHRLEKQNTKLNVFNMAGSGYATDQMLLTLEKEIDHYHPDLVVAAFICDDLYRSMLAFRDFKKPQFQLHNNALELTNTPIGSLSDVAKEAELVSYHPSSFQLLNIWHRLTGKYQRMEEDHCDGSCLELNRAMFEKMSALATSHHAEFLMVYLPTGSEMRRNDFSWYGQKFFDQYQESHNNYFLNTRPFIVAAPFNKSRGHYQSDETNLVSQLVYNKIQTLPSWQNKVGKTP